MKPLVCDALFRTEPSRTERILTRIPILGWPFAATLEQDRFRPIVHEIERQLRERSDTTSFWGDPGARQDTAKHLRRILADEFGWPNDYFLPDDPFGIVFWAHCDGLDDVSAIQRIEKVYAISLPIPELEHLWQHGTLGEFVDLVLSLSRAHDQSRSN
jgi:hypothetical protein